MAVDPVVALDYCILILLFIGQFIMQFVVFFLGSDVYDITVNITNAILLINLACILIYIFIKKDFGDKLKYVAKTQIGFIPNYVMGALVLFTYR